MPTSVTIFAPVRHAMFTHTDGRIHRSGFAVTYNVVTHVWQIYCMDCGDSVHVKANRGSWEEVKQ